MCSISSLSKLLSAPSSLTNTTFSPQSDLYVGDNDGDGAAGGHTPELLLIVEETLEGGRAMSPTGAIVPRIESVKEGMGNWT